MVITHASPKPCHRWSTPKHAAGLQRQPGRCPAANRTGQRLPDPATQRFPHDVAQRTPWRLLALLVAMAGVSSLSLNILVPAIPGMTGVFSARPVRLQASVFAFF